LKDKTFHPSFRSKKYLYCKGISSIYQTKSIIISEKNHNNANFFGHLKSEAFYPQKIKKVLNTTVQIQENSNHLSPKEYRKQVV